MPVSSHSPALTVTSPRSLSRRTEGTTSPASRRGRKLRALALLLLLLAGVAVISDPHTVFAYADFRCPAGLVERPVSMMSGPVRCERQDGSGASDATGSDRFRVALYLRNLEVRVIDLDFVAGAYLGPALSVRIR